MRTFDVSKDYSREDFAEFLRDFLPDDFEPREKETYFDFKNIERGYRLGECKSLDLDIFEFRTKSGHDPRVTLTREVVSCMKKYGLQPNALAVFYSAESHSWRLSLITTEYSIENGKVKTEHSNPRRFSFMLGEGCKAHTPETMLFNQGTVSSRDDLKSRFDIEVVTKEFYSNLFIWYNWACENVTFPTGSTEKDAEGKREVHQTDKNNSLNLIRLITRLMFVWFIKQKDLIPQWIFDKEELGKILSEFKPESETDGNYYNAVLQNLFFATLNKKIEERAFADDKKVYYNKQFSVKNFYHDNAKKSFFKESNQKIIERFRPVPFLNGGLFECLDKLVDDKDGRKNIQEFTDGFTREPAWMAFIPNMLFWQEDDGKHEGLIHLLNRYNFTVDENSPSDVQVALDPELLGKVFENLLGTYNPETSETARKSSGSFYTPRQIVSFMVDEAIKAYLSKAVKSISAEELNTLFDDGTDVFGAANKEEIVSALKKLKIFDPACGSGAFPMGALQRIVHLIQKCGGVADDKASLYALKLSLIENCLYGADIQPIAVQICKLRFFISLICEQEKAGDENDNYGIPPLPNLETKFVAANSLVGISKRKKYETGELFANPEIALTKEKLQKERHNHFNAPSAEAKAECRKNDKLLREKLSKLLQEDNMYDNREAKRLASWNPYDQNTASDFFDAEWMFNVSGGFDIVIGNPPYIQLQKAEGRLATLYETQGFETFTKTGDIYCLFYENGSKLLNKTGVLCFITSNKWMRAGYGEKLRGYFAKNVDPKLLVDFAGVKVFESATVDTNILLLKRGKNEGKTVSCTTTALTENGLANLGYFVQQNSCAAKFSSSESWVILSPIEQSIKAKIEKVGTPLKDWDISINYGIKTGFNDAFIISGARRDEILANCKTDAERKRTDELIRPILRGRDIKRYEYNFAGLYLINTHNGVKENGKVKIPRIDIKDYPAVKKHLDEYWDKISTRADKGDTPYNLRNCAYMDEFNKPKIVWAELSRTGNSFVIDTKKMYLGNTGYILTTQSEDTETLKYLLGFLNSRIILYYLDLICTRFDDNGWRWLRQFVEKIPIPKINADNHTELVSLVSKTDKQNQKILSNKINKIIAKNYGLTEEECAYIDSYLHKY